MLALIVALLLINPSTTGTMWVYYAPISTTKLLYKAKRYVESTGDLCIKSPLNS